MFVSSNIMGAGGGYAGLTQSSLVCGCIHPMLPPSGGLHPPRASPNRSQHPPRAPLSHNFSHNKLKITSPHSFCFFLFFFLSFPSPSLVSFVSSTYLIHVEHRTTVALSVFPRTKFAIVTHVTCLYTCARNDSGCSMRH